MRNKQYKIISLVMERNENLVLQDTLDHLSGFSDGIIVFDDASEDNSLDIAKSHPAVIEVVKNKKWDKNRITAQTENRQQLLDTAQKYNPQWLFYADADERFIGRIKEFLLSPAAENCDGINISLFDAYLTPDDHKSYQGGQLLNFRKYFGPERRDLLMIWKNKPEVQFVGDCARVPIVGGNFITKFFCQHYGKALSVEHWEETCDYYSKYVPYFSEKWKERRGKAIHSKSDFKTPLYTWEDVIKNSIRIYP